MNRFLSLSLLWPFTNLASLQAQDNVFQISEFLAANSDGLVDSEGEKEDWIEIYNPTDASVNLKGWFLSDDQADLRKWPCPPVAIAPKAYRIVFASGKDRFLEDRDEAHSNFRLDRNGGFLGLSSQDGLIQAFEAYPEQRADISYGIDSDGNARYFDKATPGEPNSAAREGFVADTKFSVDRGYYTESFQVEITSATPDARIIYTTDGREPGLGTIFTGIVGSRYTGPITIDKTTILRAAAFKDAWFPSNVDTHTYLFLQDVIRQSADPEGFPERWVNFPADYAMDQRVVDDPAYKEEIIKGLESIPSVSVVLPPKDLFDAKNGIYANSEARGSEWERKGSVELLRKDGKDGFVETCGVLVHGYGWRPHTVQAKHSLRLEFREDYGKPKLEYPLFPDSPVERFNSIVLRCQGSKGWQDFRDPQQTQYLHDAFARDTARDMGKIDGHATFVHLYLNGLYWGLYNPVERPDAEFGAEYFGGKPKEYDAINRRTSTNEAINGDLVAYNEMIALATRGLETPEQYAAIKQYLDVDDLIDYMLIHQYMTNRDGPEEFQSNNMRGIRKREPGAPFRFFVWDMEYSLWNADRNININVAIPGSISFVYSKLRANPEFRLLYADHVRKHFFNNGALTPEKVVERWNRRSDEIYSALIGESARWGDAKRPNQPYTRNVEWAEERRRLLEEYFPVRTDILVKQLRAADLYPALLTPDFTPYGGHIAPGSVVKMSAGTIFNVPRGDFYYTTDGSDPRDATTNRPVASALVYDRKGPGLVVHESMWLKARALDGDDWSALTEARYVTSQTPSSASLVISEIHYNPAGPSEAELAAGFDARSDFEFIELYNAGTETLDLSALRFTDGINFDFTQAIMEELAPGATALVVHHRAAFEARYGVDLPVVGEFTGTKLNDGGETLILTLRDGERIQEVHYLNQAPWPSDIEGYSLTLKEPSQGNEATNWARSQSLGGSPGVFAEMASGNPFAALALNLAQEDGHWIVSASKSADIPNVSIEISVDLQTWEPAETFFQRTDVAGDPRYVFRGKLPSKAWPQRAVYVRLREAP